MANISSFFGAMYFLTTDKSWTPEGYLLAYDVIMSQNNEYGFVISDDDIMEDSASFLVACLAYGSDPSFPIYGSGRWAANANFQDFNEWSKNKTKTQKMSDETYTATRDKLIKLMYDNGWYFTFDYIDEEGGSAYICKEVINLRIEEVETTPGKKELGFSDHQESYDGYDYNLKNYCEVIEDDRRCEYFVERALQMSKLLNISEDMQEEFEDIIVEHELDELLFPFTDIETLEEIPSEITEAWKEHCDAKK